MCYLFVIILFAVGRPGPFWQGSIWKHQSQGGDSILPHYYVHDDWSFKHQEKNCLNTDVTTQ